MDGVCYLCRNAQAGVELACPNGSQSLGFGDDLGHERFQLASDTHGGSFT